MGRVQRVDCHLGGELLGGLVEDIGERWIY